jgi:glycosyltransferase involved in cell wall biosynthesis
MRYLDCQHDSHTVLHKNNSVVRELGVSLSLGVMAWNEERAIVPMLQSLFEQTLFGELTKRNLQAEIICIANGCTDRTPTVAAEEFARQMQQHPFRKNFNCRVANIPERGKLNAWNKYIHSISSPTAQFLFLMDADILLHKPETLWRMFEALSENATANVAVGTPRKHLAFRPNLSWRERLSLQASQITGSASAQLCAQLYCIRSAVARNIYLPKDLGACEDGFIKQIVCTDFLTRSSSPERLCLVPEAEHTFEAYTSPAAILKNQKRQIIGQTVVHLLVDDYLKALPLSERQNLAMTIREKDREDPGWLKRLISQHLQKKRFFWRLYPGLVAHRLKTLSKLPAAKRLKCLPAAAAGSVAAFVGCWMAYRTLKAGSTDYWPRAEREGLNQNESKTHRILGIQTNQL